MIMSTYEISQKYKEIEEKVKAWANKQDEIRVADVIGSRARHLPDKWADLDVGVYTTDIDKTLTNFDSNVGKFGPYVFWITGVTTRGDLERRVHFEGGLDVDFAFMDYNIEEYSTIQKEELPTEFLNEIAETLHRGIRIILDKDGAFSEIFERYKNFKPIPDDPPTEDELLEIINNFWYHTIWVVKHLKRGEIYWTKTGVDDHLKSLLLKMTEYHAKAKHGQSYDTWFRGRYFEKWADPRIIEELELCYAKYEKSDVQRALLETMSLFRWVAQETMKISDYKYPHEIDLYCSGWVEDALSS
jgi:aminoglycoside 6-adenylyltransferase